MSATMFEGGDAGVSVLGVTVSVDTIFAGAGIGRQGFRGGNC